MVVVAVGSKNPVKVNSVRSAFARCFTLDESAIECVGMDVPSGVPDQPWGDDETRQGAISRASAVHAKYSAERGAPPDYAVGLEGGCVEEQLAALHPGVAGLGSVVSCFAFMAVLQIGSGTPPRWGIARTASFPLAPRIVDLMRGADGQPPMELGDADDACFADTNSKQKGGTIAKLSKGQIDRTQYYEHALVCALVPLVHDSSNPSLFGAAPASGK